MKEMVSLKLKQSNEAAVHVTFTVGIRPCRSILGKQSMLSMRLTHFLKMDRESGRYEDESSQIIGLQGHFGFALH